VRAASGDEMPEMFEKNCVVLTGNLLESSACGNFHRKQRIGTCCIIGVVPYTTDRLAGGIKHR